QLENNCQLNKEKIIYTESLLRNINTLKENLIILQSKLTILQNDIAGVNPNLPEAITKQTKINEMTNQITYLYTVYKQYKDELLVKHREVIQEMETILINLIGDLNLWKNNRKSMTVSGHESYDNFRQITEICQIFASNICLMWPQ